MYPWLEANWQRLMQARKAGRLPHALLLSGPEGAGKGGFATELAASLLCRRPRDDGEACGRCPACQLFAAGTHPDFFRIEPEEAGKSIKVDQIRQLCGELAMTSHAAGRKLAIIEPADALNANAANSLLKTLEEPTDNTLIMLVTSVPRRLPATIRSRCQQQRLPLPDTDTAQRWLATQVEDAGQVQALLAMAGGSPLRAMVLHAAGMPERYRHWTEQVLAVATRTADPVSVAAEWNKEQTPDSLTWFRRWLQDLIRHHQAGVDTGAGEQTGSLQRLPESVDCRSIHEQLDRVGDALNQWSAGLNHQLLLEAVLINWAEIWQTGARGSASGQNQDV